MVYNSVKYNWKKNGPCNGLFINAHLIFMEKSTSTFFLWHCWYLVISLVESKGSAETVNDFPSHPPPLAKPQHTHRQELWLETPDIHVRVAPEAEGLQGWQVRRDSGCWLLFARGSRGCTRTYWRARIVQALGPFWQKSGPDDCR